MADWGADVIKIEPLGGDPARTFQNMLGGDMPTNPVFELDNRSKRSIALDLSDDEGLAIAKELIAQADVFVTNVRLAGLERLGLDHETLLGEHPRLVYAAITGFGLEGPDKDRAAYDIAAFWARSGIAHMLTPEGSNPPFQRGSMGDHNAGMAAAAAVSAALYSRERTGRGQLCSTSLFRTGIYTISFDLSITVGWGLTLGVGSRETMYNPTTNNYVAGDGKRFWVVGLEANRHWPPLARGRGALGMDHRRKIRHGCGPGEEWPRANRRTRQDLRHQDARRVGRDIRLGTRLLLGAGSITRRSARRSSVLCFGSPRGGTRRVPYDLNDRHTSRFRGHSLGTAQPRPQTR